MEQHTDYTSIRTKQKLRLLILFFYRRINRRDEKNTRVPVCFPSPVDVLTLEKVEGLMAAHICSIQ